MRHLLAEVVERKDALFHLLLLAAEFFFVELRLRRFDERHYVAHPEHSARHPFRVEVFERVERFADPDEFDWNAGNRLNGKRRAAASVAVELRQNNAVEFERVVKRLGAVDRVLPGHRVDDEVNLVGLDFALDLVQLRHQLFVDVQAPGGVEDNDVDALVLRLFQRATANVDRVFRFAVDEDRNAELTAQHFQLIDSGGTLQVGGDEHRFATGGQEAFPQFAATRRFTRPLQPAKHNRRERLLFRKRMVDRAHQRDQLVVDDLQNLLRRVQRAGNFEPENLFLNGIDELARRFDVRVRFEQRLADEVHPLANIRFGKATLPRHRAERGA